MNGTADMTALEARISRQQSTSGARASRLAIIGTAGRGTDQQHMSLALYRRMLDAGRAVVRAKNVTSLVSGGAAWADHVAVTLALEGVVAPSELTLHLPAPLRDGQFDETARDGKVSNHYHRLFRARSGIDGVGELEAAIRAGASWSVNPGGFKARNSDVARDAGLLLAFTFGSGEAWKAKVHQDVTAAGAGLKDGGTADTWNKSRAAVKIHVRLAPPVCSGHEAGGGDLEE